MERLALAPGYEVSRVIRGGWQLAGGHGAVDGEAAVDDLLAAFDAGITTFDCADIYTGVEALYGRFRRRLGETRGQEAYALIKACCSGHDGSVTTMHADSGEQAIRQMRTYVMEAGLAEQVAREQVSRAFNLVVQVSKIGMGRRAITEIRELEPVLEGANQRSSVLFAYDPVSDSFTQTARPTDRFLQHWSKYGANFDGHPGR